MLLCIGFVSTLIFIQIFVQEHKDTTVPVLIGLDTAAANLKLEKLGLQVHKKENIYHFKYKAGVIVDQSPKPGLEVSQGRDIYVVVSSGIDPDWKSGLLKQSNQQRTSFLSAQGVKNIETHLVCLEKNSSPTLLDASWDPDTKILHLLKSDQACEKPWVFKGLARAKDFSNLERDAREKKISVKKVTSMGAHENLSTNPSSGEILGTGDIIVIQARP